MSKRVYFEENSEMRKSYAGFVRIRTVFVQPVPNLPATHREKAI